MHGQSEGWIWGISAVPQKIIIPDSQINGAKYP